MSCNAVSGGSVNARALASRRIVVTRPAGQALHFAEMIRAAGGGPMMFPTIDIAPLKDNTALDAVLARLNQFDLAVFVSANAVLHAFARLDALKLAWRQRAGGGELCARGSARPTAV